MGKKFLDKEIAVRRKDGKRQETDLKIRYLGLTVSNLCDDSGGKTTTCGAGVQRKSKRGTNRATSSKRKSAPAKPSRKDKAGAVESDADVPYVSIDSEDDDDGETSGPSSRTLECPVCLKSFVASEAAMSAHFAEHFGSSFSISPSFVILSYF